MKGNTKIPNLSQDIINTFSSSFWNSPVDCVNQGCTEKDYVGTWTVKRLSSKCNTLTYTVAEAANNLLEFNEYCNGRVMKYYGFPSTTSGNLLSYSVNFKLQGKQPNLVFSRVWREKGEAIVAEVEQPLYRYAKPALKTVWVKASALGKTRM